MKNAQPKYISNMNIAMGIPAQTEPSRQNKVGTAKAKAETLPASPLTSKERYAINYRPPSKFQLVSDSFFSTNSLDKNRDLNLTPQNYASCPVSTKASLRRLEQRPPTYSTRLTIEKQ